MLTILLAIAVILIQGSVWAGSPSTNLLPLPISYQNAVYVPALSFDYSVAQPSASAWTANQSAISTTSGLNLLITSSAIQTGTFMATTNLPTNATNFRMEVTFQIGFNYGANKCPIVGIHLYNTQAPPTYKNDFTISNYSGLGYWQEVCANGIPYGGFTSATVASFTPPGSTMLQPCASCSLKNSTLDLIQIILQSVNDEGTALLMHNSYNSPYYCFSRGGITGVSTAISNGIVGLSLVGEVGGGANITIPKFSFFSLQSQTTTAAGTTVADDILLPVPSAFSATYKSAFSFDGTTVGTANFPYAMYYQAGTLSNMIVLNGASTNVQAAIVSNNSLSTSSTNFRIEANFSLLGFIPSTVNSSNYVSMLYFAIVTRQATPIDMITAISSSSFSQFGGLIIALAISSSGKMVTWVQPNLNLSLALAAGTYANCGACSLLTGYSLQTGNNKIAIQVINEQLTVSVQISGASSTAVCYSDYPVTGISSVISSGSAVVQVAKYTSNDLATVKMASLSFFELSSQSTASTTTSLSATNPATTSTTPVPTTTTIVLDSIESGFPVPALIKGHADPLVTVEDILHCTFVQKSVRAPDASASTEIYFSFKIDRLLDIDDLSETISVSAIVYLQWQVHTCPANETAEVVTEKERVIVTSSSLVWHPTVIFANSSNDVYMQSTQFGDDMQILFLPTTPNRTLYFYWTRVGIFNSKCALDLRRFPFDVQTCDFTFLMKEPHEFVEFGGIFMTPPMLSPNAQWILCGTFNETGYVPSTVVRNGLASYALVQLSFARNPSYHLSNLLAPCFILISLIFGSFLMPPEKADRPVICCTILLAFIVAQSDVIKEVPQTSQRILLAEYILFFTGLSAMVTLYDMAMCWIVRISAKMYHERKIFSQKWFRLSAARAFDLAAFLLAFDFFVMINLYAILTIED